MYLLALLIFLTFMCTACAVIMLEAVARRHGFIVHPGGRKAHNTPTPPVGGLAIVPVVVVIGVGGSCLALKCPAILPLPVLLCILGLLVLGAADDRWQLSAKIKFVAQLLAALAAVSNGLVLHDLGSLFALGGVELGAFAVPFTVLALVVLMNAVNMVDGVDGLAGSLLLIMSVALACMAMIAGQVDLAVLMGCTAAAITAFLMFNMRFPWQHRARVFLGDAGSMSLAFFIGCVAIKLADGAGPGVGVEPGFLALILIFPVIDAMGVIIRRLRKGMTPFEPDRGHLHHHLLDSGFSVTATVSMFGMVQLGLTVFALAGIWFGWSPLAATILIFGVAGIHHALIVLPVRPVRFKPVAGGPRWLYR